MATSTKIPHPGELNQIVEIGYTESVINENGYPEPKDVTLCRVWAGVADDLSHYKFSSDAENAERGLAFTIRWRADLRPGMWVMWRGEKWNITEIGEYDFRRRYMKLVTNLIRGVK